MPFPLRIVTISRHKPTRLTEKLQLIYTRAYKRQKPTAEHSEFAICHQTFELQAKTTGGGRGRPED